MRQRRRSTGCWSPRPPPRRRSRRRSPRRRGGHGDAPAAVSVIDEKRTACAPLPAGARIPPLWLLPFVYLLVVGLVLAAMLIVAIGAQVIFAVAGRTLPPDIM